MLRQAHLMSVITLAVVTSVGSASSVKQAERLPNPPSMQTAALPRSAGDKPGELFAAVNPRDASQAVVSYQQAIQDGCDHTPGVAVTAHVAWTSDGGRQWKIAEGTSHPSYLRSLDTGVTFDAHGHAFLIYLALDQMAFMSPMTTRHGEFVSRSLDGGQTWSSPIALIERPEAKENAVFEHMPKIVADKNKGSPHAGNLYAAWDRILKMSPNEEAVAFTRSTDDGATWSEAHLIGPKQSSALLPTIAVGHDGRVYVLSVLYQFTGKPWQTMLQVSNDGGQTFDLPRPAIQIEQPMTKAGQASWGVADFPRAGGWPTLAMDSRPGGRLYIIWGDYRNGDRDIFVASSGDAGKTWSTPARVNDDAISNGKDQIMQWLTVDPSDGALYVIFYDRRYDPQNRRATVTLARSIDEGRTFKNYAWSDELLDPTLASFGEYIGIAAQSGRVYAAWTENLPQSDRAAVPQKPAAKAVPGEYESEESDCPSGPSQIRIGVANFSGL